MVLEQKIGFDKVREKIAAKCATQYAARKVAAEQISRWTTVIFVRLQSVSHTTEAPAKAAP